MIKLFEIDNNVVKPTEHCQTIKWLKVIGEKYPENKLKIFGYLFYMACPSQENPYFNIVEDLREEVIIGDLDIDFSLEEDEIIEGLEKARKMYETPTVRAYKSITIMLDNLSEYMTTAEVTAGRDGNINSLLRIAKEFDAIRQSYKGVVKDLEAEQKAHVRGSQQLGYDQI